MDSFAITFLGRPPFLPLLRDDSALAEEVDCPPLRPSCDIQAFVPKIPATNPAMLKSASKRSKLRSKLMTNPNTLLDYRLETIYPSSDGQPISESTEHYQFGCEILIQQN